MILTSPSGHNLWGTGPPDHTREQYARGLEATGGSYYFLDLTALGRQEEWRGAQGSQRVRKVGHARLRVMTVPPR